MVGNDDDIVDALFSFTHPITGSYFWYPPVKDGKVSL
jgi:putative iron-dependent peroxidase